MLIRKIAKALGSSTRRLKGAVEARLSADGVCSAFVV